MAERKNTEFDRPGGYAMPKGATQVQRRAARDMVEADIRLYGDSVAAHVPRPLAGSRPLAPAFSAGDPDTRLYVGDCRDVLAQLPDKGCVDLVFADPPFNWEVPYAGDDGSRPEQNGRRPKGDDRRPSSGWNDGMPRAEYERFTFDWLDGCIDALAPHGSIFVNIPDDTAAECVLHLKRRGLTMINWCIWHFRFGQHRDSSFIMSKVHVLYFAKMGMNHPRPGHLAPGESPGAKWGERIWNASEILELSDRAAIYNDPRTMSKENGTKGMRVPMDVWYGKYWGRIQGNNKERRHNHHNQIPEIYLERVIKACSNSGGLVLDPFCGSGTTSTVARALGRRSITIEYSKVNAKSAWERITKVGMVKREDNGPQSSAIFKKRGTRKAQPAAAE
jgi:DNA modification methylase